MTSLWAEGDALTPTNLNTKIQSVITTSITTVVVPSVNTANGVFSVKDYGAVGDGITDDTTACRSAAGAAVGAVLYFPAGSYKLSSNITLGNGTTVQGASGAKIQQTSNTTSTFQAYSVSSVVIRDLTIIGAGTYAGSNSNHAAVLFDDAQHCRVEGCSISSFYIGIETANNISRCTGLIVTNNFIDRTFDNGIGLTAHLSISSPMEQCIVCNNVITNCGSATSVGKGIEIRRVANSVVGNNVIRNCHNGGIQLEEGCTNVTVDGNVISDGFGAGINLLPSLADNYENIISNNCISSLSSYGIWFNGSGFSNTIIGNSIVSCGLNGIYITSPSVVSTSGNRILGNEIMSCGGTSSVQGIDLATGDFTLVSGNRITKSGGDGISLRFGSAGGNVVSNNICLDNNVSGGTAAGIHIQNSQSSTVLTGNACYNSISTGQTFGIWIDSGPIGCVVNGNVLSPNSTSGLSDRGTSTLVGFNQGASTHIVLIGNDAIAAPPAVGAQIFQTAADGLVIIGKSGTLTDLVLANNETQGATVLSVASGTRMVSFASTSLLTTGTAGWPALAFSSETSLGVYRSTASTIALSYGALDVRNGALSVRSTNASATSATLNDGEFRIAAVSTTSAELAYRSGNTTYRFIADATAL